MEMAARAGKAVAKVVAAKEAVKAVAREAARDSEPSSSPRGRAAAAGGSGRTAWDLSVVLQAVGRTRPM